MLKAVAPGHLAEAGRVHCVQADVDAPQSRIEERLSLIRQKDAVGRQADVLDAGNGGEHAHQPVEVPAHERFAAGQANLVDAQRSGDPDEVRDFLESEQFRAVHEHNFFRHAVGAAQVAPVRDADAEVVVDAAKGVDQRAVHE